MSQQHWASCVKAAASVIGVTCVLAGCQDEAREVSCATGVAKNVSILESWGDDERKRIVVTLALSMVEGEVGKREQIALANKALDSILTGFPDTEVVSRLSVLRQVTLLADKGAVEELLGSKRVCKVQLETMNHTFEGDGAKPPAQNAEEATVQVQAPSQAETV